ncbi:MAG: TonB-dependent receptor [Bryobacteraceae bacterium]
MRKSLFLFLFVAALLVAMTAFGQSTASIVGTVTDSSGGAVPGARVAAVNTETGLRVQRESAADGSYRILLLPFGDYRLEVEKEGFQRYARSGVRLAVGDTATLDVSLAVGSLSESVTVTDAAPLLETQTGTVRGVVDQQRIVNLPLNGRRVTQLMTIQAGVIQRSSGTSEGDAFVVNGSRQSGVYFLLDGGMNTDSYRNYSGVFPNPDAVQEFSVQKSNFSAEYANATGAVMSVVTKSGTNEFHGSAFEFLRNYNLNARNFFAARRDSLKRHQFGGTFGGPIRKDKLFFFAAYQGTRVRSEPQLTRQFLPTAAMRRGDFVAGGRDITDPLTRAPFPGRVIPASRLSGVTQALLKYMPDPGTPTGERFVGVPLKNREEEFTIKTDYNMQKHRLTGRYFYQRFERPFTGNLQDLASMFASEVGRSTQPYNQLTVSDVWTVSPEWLNNLTVAYRWRRTLNDWTSIKLPITFQDAGVKGIAVKEPASVYVSVTGGFLARPGWNYDKKDYDIHIANTSTRMKGAHEIKFGGEILRSTNDIKNDFRTMGLFVFNGNITGTAMADYMLGDVYSFDQGGGEYKSLYGTRWGFFGQDNWRVKPNLTLTLGLRWDPMIPFHDDIGRTQCFAPGQASTRFPKAPLGYLNDGDPGCPKGGFNRFLGQIAPRFGFAWRVGTKNVIRGGYGLFWNPQFTVLYNGFVNAAPFSPQVTRFGVRFEEPYAGAGNPFPASFAPFVPKPDSDFITPLGSFGAFAPTFQPSYQQTYNLTLEREVMRNMVARASYIGNLGRHLTYTDDLNYARYAAGATTGNIQQRRPYGNFGSILMTYGDSTSSYHGLQLSVERRVSNSFSFEVNYTLSKSIDEVSSDATPQNPTQTIPLDLRANRGVSDFDQPQRLIVSHVWALPKLSGQSKALRSVAGGWEFSGITTIRSGFPFSVSSGSDRAFSGLGANRADVVGNPFLPTNRSRADLINQYFNPAAFATNALGTFGTAPRNLLRGPGGPNFDLALMKVFSPVERVRVQFRAELFNSFNTPILGTPFATQNTPARFGRIESAGDPRIVQLGLKLAF